MLPVKFDKVAEVAVSKGKIPQKYNSNSSAKNQNTCKKTYCISSVYVMEFGYWSMETSKDHP